MRLTRLYLGSVKLAMDTYFNHLNGVFCIYKHTGVSTEKAIFNLKDRILKGLNSLPAYDHEIAKYYKEKDTLKQVQDWSSVPMTTSSVPDTVQDYSKHKLVLGEMFLTDDIYLNFLHGINRYSSGVVVCGLGKEGRKYLEMIKMAKYLRVYHVKGRFGYATDNFYTDGNFIERTTYAHINKGKLDRVCSAAQSAHQRLMFVCAGVNPHSQEAYELASQGLVRPADDNTTPILYGIKCIEFTPPDFTLEVHAINEDSDYLAQLVHDIGLQLKSTAVCTHIHRNRYGIFNLDLTLLKKEWNIQEIAKNITTCRALLTPENLLTNIQLTTGNNEQQLDLLSESVQNGEGPSKDDILKDRAMQELDELREQFVRSGHKSFSDKTNSKLSNLHKLQGKVNEQGDS
ncbi:pseudouridylate synthase TRUB2, mitochondrial-like [Mercenaria mercenaria]|uniref:pseudouridylate synthase TRUB2, mitochondrial-like n=1 Tax=Mercenaria mercenaria TaxID=6596 RepID=UPI00234F76C6|nr:pseudouridylate synthase TRUB2, mitochondrial-like [Mercenaria mercenaria]XP_053380778.1 pseudouridylate synthase TRUB2, mitochondrial-like [Mercenaria mercenaria]XP_053380779.1 pseudouridylate synthase TRUB2, mitochondrial-like [Mercenaria mercenaria]